jgi:D-amino-acid dehydrogenase
LPDFLPAIGPIPGQPRVIAAFGHQHIGLTTAAVTGALVRDLVLGVPPAVDLAPFAPGRFGGRLPAGDPARG